jgi:hypothetical protein
VDKPNPDTNGGSQQSKRIFFIWNGPADGTSGRLFNALAKFTASKHCVRVANNITKKYSTVSGLVEELRKKITRVRTIFWCDTLVVHSYAAFSLPEILLARALNRKVVIFQWDIYPTVCNGKSLGGPLRPILDWVEGLASYLASSIVIPSEDFRSFIRHRNVVVMPLWPSAELEETVREPQNPKYNGGVRVVFTGQFGETRGVKQAIVNLGAYLPAPIELNIFGPSKPVEEFKHISPNVEVIFHGMVPQQVLVEKIREFDYGLICLNPSLETPGFPSKVFEYVNADIPVIYSGPVLRSFEALVCSTGIGYVMRGPSGEYSGSSVPWKIAKNLFYCHTSLKWNEVEKIL